MPRKGYKVITVKEKLFERIKSLIEDARQGKVKLTDRNGAEILSISGFTEDAILTKIER